MKISFYKNTLLFIVCVFSNLGCSKSDETCELVSFTPIINSQQELDAQIIPGPLSSYIGFKNVDFKTSTLLVGKKLIGNGAGQLVSQQVNQVCKSNKYIYKVVIKDGGYTVLTKFFFGVLVPKKDAASVIFDVKVIK